MCLYFKIESFIIPHRFYSYAFKLLNNYRITSKTFETVSYGQTGY